MAFIFLIAPTGKERPLPRGAGHAPISLGILAFAAFKPSVSLHLPMALLKHRSGGKGLGKHPLEFVQEHNGGTWDRC